MVDNERMNTTHQPTTWTRLRDGSWGIKGDARRIVKGASELVASRDGRTEKVHVGRVVWTDGTTTIAAAAKPTTSTRRGGNGQCMCGSHNRRDYRCADCGAQIFD